MALSGQSYEQITVWVGGMSRKASIPKRVCAESGSAKLTLTVSRFRLVQSRCFQTNRGQTPNSTGPKTAWHSGQGGVLDS